MATYYDLRDDTKGLAIAFQSIQLSNKQREHLRKLYNSVDGEPAARNEVTNVVKSETRVSCSAIGGLLTGYFEGVGPKDKMMWIGYLPKDTHGRERWMLKPEIRETLRILNWFGPGPDISLSKFEVEFEVRARRFSTVEVRIEQASFRSAVFAACRGMCVISGCTVPEVLEAAHLVGRKWRQGHNAAVDGILLRRDLHALFDTGLLTIDTTGLVHISAEAQEDYGDVDGIELAVRGVGEGVPA
jgi:hypothetical protein